MNTVLLHKDEDIYNVDFTDLRTADILRKFRSICSGPVLAVLTVQVKAHAPHVTLVVTSYITSCASSKSNVPAVLATN